MASNEKAKLTQSDLERSLHHQIFNFMYIKVASSQTSLTTIFFFFLQKSSTLSIVEHHYYKMLQNKNSGRKNREIPGSLATLFIYTG